MRLPENIQGLYRDLRDGLIAALGDRLYGIYVYGAAAFPETAFTGDIDFHAILVAALTDAERSAIAALHSALAMKFPPLGADLDGYYILLEEARRASPPVHQLQPNILDESWALHRAHIRAGRYIVVYGPHPEDIYPPPSWEELEQALMGELAYVQAHIDDYPDYCILNLCRLMYSFETQDVVVSKAASAGWAQAAYPQWRELIEAAKRSYAGLATADERAWLESQVRSFFDFAGEQITRRPSPR